MANLGVGGAWFIHPEDDDASFVVKTGIVPSDGGLEVPAKSDQEPSCGHSVANAGSGVMFQRCDVSLEPAALPSRTPADVRSCDPVRSLVGSGHPKNSVAAVCVACNLRQRVNSDPIPVRLPPDLQRRVDELCGTLSLSRSAVLRMAVKQWLDAAEVHGMNPMVQEVHSSGPVDPVKAPGTKIVYPKGRSAIVPGGKRIKADKPGQDGLGDPKTKRGSSRRKGGK